MDDETVVNMLDGSSLELYRGCKIAQQNRTLVVSGGHMTQDSIVINLQRALHSLGYLDHDAGSAFAVASRNAHNVGQDVSRVAGGDDDFGGHTIFLVFGWNNNQKTTKSQNKVYSTGS